MQKYLSINLVDSESLKQATLIARKNNYLLKVCVLNKESFCGSIYACADILSVNNDIVKSISIKDPCFENTVYVVSTMEDLFNINFDSIVIDDNNEKYIFDICDFYNSICKITISSVKQNPIKLALFINQYRLINGFYNLGMSIDAIRKESNLFLNQSIFNPLSEFIHEMEYIVVPGVYKNPFNIKYLLNSLSLNDKVLLSLWFSEYDYTSNVSFIESFCSSI